MAAKKSTSKNASNVGYLVAMAIGIFLIITGVTSADVNSWRAFLMAAGFFALIFGIIGYKK